MNTGKIIKSYTTQYTDPITLKTGQEVELGEEEQEEKWKGWIFATLQNHDCSTHAGEPAREQQGWIPMQILRISDDRKKGFVLSDYTAKELDAEAGDDVERIHSLNGWTWCRSLRTNDEGWIPDEIIAY